MNFYLVAAIDNPTDLTTGLKLMGIEEDEYPESYKIWDGEEGEYVDRPMLNTNGTHPSIQDALNDAEESEETTIVIHYRLDCVSLKALIYEGKPIRPFKTSFHRRANGVWTMEEEQVLRVEFNQ